jgi:hypothetical protein
MHIPWHEGMVLGFELDIAREGFGHKGGIVPAAYLRAVPHQRGDLVQLRSLPGQLASQSVLADQASPR